MLWRNLHLITGTIGLILFVLQGQYMANILDVPKLTDIERMLYRSAHIYFLGACAANVCLGYSQSAGTQVRWQQRLASSLILLAPFLILASFFMETGSESIDRPGISLGMYALFGGAAIIATDAIWQKFKKALQR